MKTTMVGLALATAALRPGSLAFDPTDRPLPAAGQRDEDGWRHAR